jgi:alpha-glucosidase (family GH31 glycosyl hydrolase)
MIRHRPGGRGHPYEPDPDQRIPVQPIAGQPLRIQATADPTIQEVRLELRRGGTCRQIDAACVSTATAEAGVTEDGSHLAAAAAAARASSRPVWEVTLDELQPGERLEYRFVSANGSGDHATRWHRTAVAAWDREGGELRVERTDDGAAHAAGVTARVLPDTLRWLVADGATRGVRFALRLDPSEHVVGFGERFDALDQRGRCLDAVVFEQYKQQGARSYLPMPFAIIVGGDGWGFHLATSRRAHFDVAATDADRLWVEVELDPHDPPELTVQLFAGDPAAVLAGFLSETGPPTMPPEWIFGPWMSGNEWNTQARVLAEVERSAKEEIPCSVLVIEAWSDEETFTAFRDAEYQVHPDGAPHALADFTFPREGAWPDPKAMVDELHRRGIRVLLWQIPLLKARAEPDSQLAYDRQALVARGYAVRQADGRPYANRGWWFPAALLPDFTSPEAREWWTAKRRYLVEELGIDGFKTDGGEHAWGDDLRYADGTRGAETNNRYPLLYTAAYHELLARAGREGATFSRAGFTGSPAYPCHWAGDEDSTWEALRASITAGLSAGACGIFFWGFDLAGFSGEIPSAELYLRAAAAACFSPIMQYHSEYNHHRRPSRDRTPWNIAERTGDTRVLPAYRSFAQLRMRLIPYLRAQAQRSIEQSKPLMRALFFEASDDPRIWDFPYQYFLGDDLLVAPVVEPDAETWRVYLPAGEWVDAWSGEQLTGTQVVERAAPLEEIPVYVAAQSAARLRTQFRDDPSEGP